MGLMIHMGLMAPSAIHEPRARPQSGLGHLTWADKGGRPPGPIPLSNGKVRVSNEKVKPNAGPGPTVTFRLPSSARRPCLADERAGIGVGHRVLRLLKTAGGSFPGWLLDAPAGDGWTTGAAGWRLPPWQQHPADRSDRADPSAAPGGWERINLAGLLSCLTSSRAPGLTILANVGASRRGEEKQHG